MKKLEILGLFFFVAILMACNQSNDEDRTQEVLSKYTYEISIDEAQQELEKILSVVDGTTRSSAQRKIKNRFSIDISGTKTRNSNTENVIHIFNFEGGKGFAILAGDRRKPSLLALSNSGELTDSTKIDNPGLAQTLERLDSLYKQQEKPQDPKKPDLIVSGTEEIKAYFPNGLCPVKWGQGYPYNKECPIIDNTEHAVTGCVATAVAQLMATYQYPSLYNGYNFNWNDMTNSKYGFGLSSEAQNQLAHLFNQLGKQDNLDVNYGLKASGAATDNVIRTLSNFGYSNGGELIDYNTDKVVSELMGGHCILLSGYSEKKEEKVLGVTVSTHYSGGHLWLGHGLLRLKKITKIYRGGDPNYEYDKVETYWYVLCNFGWEGDADGYYLSDAFNADYGPSYSDATRSNLVNDNGESPNKYQYKVKAIINIRK